MTVTSKKKYDVTTNNVLYRYTAKCLILLCTPVLFAITVNACFVSKIPWEFFLLLNSFAVFFPVESYWAEKLWRNTARATPPVTEYKRPTKPYKPESWKKEDWARCHKMSKVHRHSISLSTPASRSPMV